MHGKNTFHFCKNSYLKYCTELFCVENSCSSGVFNWQASWVCKCSKTSILLQNTLQYFHTLDSSLNYHRYILLTLTNFAYPKQDPSRVCVQNEQSQKIRGTWWHTCSKIYSHSEKMLLGYMHHRYSPEKWLHNWIYYPSNRSKQIQETHTAYSAGTQYTRQSLNEKQHTWLHKQQLSVKPCVLSSIQTLPRRSCVGTIGRVSFLDLFGPIAGVINPIM